MKILLSFIAVNNDNHNQETNDFGPSVNFINHFNKKEVDGKKENFSKAYFFYAPEERQEKVRQYLEKTLREQKLLDEKNIIFKDWTAGNRSIIPTNHKDILFSLAGKEPQKEGGLIREIIRENSSEKGEPEYIIHISPGTPSMHALWLLIPFSISFHWEYKIFQSSKQGGNYNISPVNIEEAFFQQLGGGDKADAISYFPSEGEIYQELDKKISLYKKSPFPILLLGERGTGKTVLAKKIRNHRIDSTEMSHRQIKKENWTVLACGQFSPELMRSELFGHKKGAFTGADSNEDGILKRMDGDTLFLDEIGDLSEDTQRLLIRALDEKQFTPLGSVKSEKSDFRLISATNKNLDELMESMHYDFFDRISIHTIELPCIRKHRNDIRFFWDDILNEQKKIIEKYKKIPALSHKGRTRIIEELSSEEKFSLAGNFRDLKFVAIHYLLSRQSQGDEATAIEYGLKALAEREKRMIKAVPQSSGIKECLKDWVATISLADFKKSNLGLEELQSVFKKFFVEKAQGEKFTKTEASRLFKYKSSASLNSDWVKFPPSSEED